MEEPQYSMSSNLSGGPSTSGGNYGQQTLVTPEQRIRRRNRMITSCLECRRRKQKCNKAHPCSHCIQHRRQCVFLSPALDPLSQSKLTEVKEKMGTLERMLERDIARAGLNAQRDREREQDREREDPLPGKAEEDVPPREDEKDLEPTPLAVMDVAYEDDADDDLFDLGIQLGRMRINERLGGFFRPMIAEEINNTLTDPKNDRRSLAEKQASPDLVPPPPSIADILAPGASYIAPGDRSAPTYFFGAFDHTAPIMTYLPSREAADRLIRRYFQSVHPLARLVHKPTFDNQYESFWRGVNMGIEPAYSLQALIFAAMFSGAVSMSEEAILADFHLPKSTVVENFRMGAEASLSKANFIRTTKLETVQAFVMYLIPLCRDQISRAHSALTATAIRIAECMGLHRDGEVYGLSPIETHVRRLVWYQLCFLDLRTCESQGPRPGIRREDYDAKFPLEIDDAELMPGGPPPRPRGERWTDVTFSLIRFECNEMHRVLWFDLPRLEKKELTVTSILKKIETFRERMDKKYMNVINTDVPIQRAAKHVMRMLIPRMYVMVLHRYFKKGQHSIPTRLRQLTITNGLIQLENAISLETDPALRPWVWYAGAWQQWQTALLMLTDIWNNPHRPEASRIWACLDYVFQCDPSLPRDQKARIILMEIRDKAGIFRSIRRVKLPVAMTERIRPTPLGPIASGAKEADGSIGWPSPRPSATSPSNSSGDSPSASAASPSQMGGYTRALKDDIMADIDWEELDRMFPPGADIFGLDLDLETTTFDDIKPEFPLVEYGSSHKT